MLLICWSLSVSFENLTGGAGDVRFEGAGFTGVGLEEFCFAMLVRVDWHFSCCFLNLFKLSCKDAIWRKNKPIKNYYQEHRWPYGSRTWFTVSADSETNQPIRTWNEPYCSENAYRLWVDGDGQSFSRNGQDGRFLADITDFSPRWELIWREIYKNKKTKADLLLNETPMVLLTSPFRRPGVRFASWESCVYIYIYYNYIILFYNIYI